MDPENEVKVNGDRKKPQLNIFAPQRQEDYVSRKYGVPTTPVPQPTIPIFGSPLETFSYYFPESPYAVQDTSGIPSPQEKAFRRAQANIGRGPAYQFTEAPVQEEITRDDVLNEIMARFGLLGGGGGGAVRPDYSAYRQAITDQASQLNAQIQAMYNQLAEQAGSNVGRIQDIYGGATAGIEAGYGSAAENVAQAYESAQQQAADQMARLGIEEAAGQVLPSQALSQAEALAQLETGRAGGLSAAERYGASGAQFGSEMAQVAQQQGTEMNAAILAALQNRLNESLLAEAQGAVSGGGGSPALSFSDQLRLQEYADEVYRRDVLGELPLSEREFAADLASQQAQAQARFASDIAADAIKIAADNRDMSFEEAQAAAIALRQIPQ